MNKQLDDDKERILQTSRGSPLLKRGEVQGMQDKRLEKHVTHIVRT